VCCAKLVFLPAVIAWQLFEEVRDKLQAKYHELQVNSQVRRTDSSQGLTDSLWLQVNSQVRRTKSGLKGLIEGPCWTLVWQLLLVTSLVSSLCCIVSCISSQPARGLPSS
jgi:hypothetical protein